MTTTLLAKLRIDDCFFKTYNNIEKFTVCGYTIEGYYVIQSLSNFVIYEIASPSLVVYVTKDMVLKPIAVRSFELIESHKPFLPLDLSNDLPF